ncbi:MAG: DUF4197 domain-containing protein [Bacteroidetes bacterium]|nr:DUF4197 domain-containing protein [Bacteroidota bacterium]
MKRIFLAVLVLSLFINEGKAQTIKDIINTASGVFNGNNLSNDEVIKGLREALTVGANNGSSKASKTDGFFKNTLIKILMPPEAKNMEAMLRKVGAGKQVDVFVMQLNRAAEDASKSAAPIFLDAIKKITINDGLQILNGNDDAATRFLQKGTNAQLLAAFTPIVKASLSKVQITKYWNPLATKYNKIPLAKKVNPNLENYVTGKAIEGLFKLIAQEETKIRKDPMAQVSDLLKKVFGKKG